MKKVSIEVGDMISVDGPGYKHVGIYVGHQLFYGDRVVHNRKGYGVVISSLQEFSGGSQIYIRRKAIGSYWDKEEVVQRAMSLVGKQYDLDSVP